MKSVDAMEKPIRYGVLDIETRRSAEEVGGWGNAREMGVSVAVLYDSGGNHFMSFLQEEMDSLYQKCLGLDLVVGFNIIGFDYKVLSGVSDNPFAALPTLDLLQKVHRALGYRLSLDTLAQGTLDAKKSAEGLQAIEWWKAGEMDKIVEYCRQDVKLTRDLYLHGLAKGRLRFENKKQQMTEFSVSW